MKPHIIFEHKQIKFLKLMIGCSYTGIMEMLNEAYDEGVSETEADYETYEELQELIGEAAGES